MSQMTIDCPGCGSPLLVPESAAGRKARCKECNDRFVVPSVEEMLEQTVSAMVLEELEERTHEHEADLPEARASEGRPARDTHPVSANGTVLGVPAVAEPPADPGTPGNTANPGDSAPGVLSMDRLEDPSEPEPEAEADAAYPADLRPAAPRPYLVVREVTMRGVTLAFAAEWLHHEAFRTAMPLRCAFSGKGTAAGLVSRPVVFINRTRGTDERARALELRYEQTVDDSHSPREHARAIGRMEHLAPPFDRPLLYYATPGHAADALTARATTDDDGRESGELLLPHGEVAARWLERVNGRCGPEYARLRAAVAHLLHDGWARLPENTQRRLQTWCRFERGERFKLYLNDADLTAADAGLGGVVVTDRRLLYHKFRRSRSVSLHQDATLHLRTDGRVARLTLESAGRLARAGKVHRADLDALIHALADAPRLRVVVGSAATEANPSR
ncbi:MAG: hypothetical protein AAF710_11980 [Planctomycetota bacterium]